MLALIRAESVSLAAHSRNSSHSAYSRRLQALEHLFDTDLVDWPRRPSGPTYQLRSLQVELEAVLVGLNRLSDAFAITSAEPLRIAALHSISANILPRALAAFGDALASHDLRLRSANQETCFQMLMTEEVMVAFFYEAETRRLNPPKDLVHRALVCKDGYVPVAAARKLQEFQARSERDEVLPIICYPSNVFMGDLTRLVLLPQIPQRVSLKIVSGLTQTITKCIEHGLGVGWLPRSSIEDQLANGTLVELSDLGFPTALIDLTMMRLKTRSFSQHEKVVEAISAEISAILSQQT